jgi:tRNA(Ile)-lysidine synthase TilS/MesJ
MMQKLLSKTRQAINDFNMIEENDKIAVGLSGGKDSVTLLHILKNYQKFSPIKIVKDILLTVNFLMYCFVDYLNIFKVFL